VDPSEFCYENSKCLNSTQVNAAYNEWYIKEYPDSPKARYLIAERGFELEKSRRGDLEKEFDDLEKEFELEKSRRGDLEKEFELEKSRRGDLERRIADLEKSKEVENR
jgi:hypothetical protein